MVDADAVTLQLAQALAMHSPGLAEGFTAGSVPGRFPGAVPQTAAIAVDQGRPRVLATMDHLSIFTTVSVLATAAQGPRFRTWRLDDTAAFPALLPDIVAAIAQWETAHSKQTNAMDVAFRLRAVLEANAPVPEAFWICETWSPAYDAPAGCSVNLWTTDRREWRGVINAEQRDDGVHVSGPAFEALSVVRTLADVDAQLSGWLQALVPVLERRREFLARPFRAGQAAALLTDALTRDVPTPDGSRWLHRDDDTDFRAPGRAQVFFGSIDHVTVRFEETARGLSVAAWKLDLLVDGRTALEQALPALVDATKTRLQVLTLDRLEPGHVYRVLQPFRGLNPGDTVTFVELRYYARDNERFYDFRGPGGGQLALDEYGEEDRRVLFEPWKYLAWV